jgi:hypothetical protein
MKRGILILINALLIGTLACATITGVFGVDQAGANEDSGEGESLVIENAGLEEGEPQPTERTPQETPTTEVPSEMNLLKVNHFVDNANQEIWVVGLAQNVGTSMLTYVTAEAYLYDADGELIADESLRTELRTLRPGEVTPFWVVVYGPDKERLLGFDQLEVRFDYSVDNSVTNIYREFELVSAELGPSDLEVFKLEGEIRNIGDQEGRNPTVIAVFYDTEGSVIAVSKYNVYPTNVPPGETATFNIQVHFTASDQVDHYELFYESYPQE